MRISTLINHWRMDIELPSDTKDEQLRAYYREKSAETADIVRVHEYWIDEYVKEFEAMF